MRELKGGPRSCGSSLPPSSQSGQNFGQYVRQLSATLRPIGAYLAEMVDSLPRDLAPFMLRTAVLDKFSADLCKAVTQHKSSGDFLESIANRQLLLVPLDRDGRWYRYHHLLSAYLANDWKLNWGRRKLRPCTGVRRTGTPHRNSGLTRSNTQSLPAIPSKRQAGSRTAP